MKATRSWVPVALVVAALGLFAATVGVLAGGAGDGTDAPATSTSTSAPPASTTSTPDVSIEDLSGSARELAALLAEGRGTTYHARYSGTATSNDGGSLTLETWAKGGRFRQDTVVDVSGQALHRINFVLTDGGASCTRLGDAEWSCSEVPLSEVQGSDLLNGNTLDQLRRAAVGESSGEVDGRPARCFVITYDAQTTELCASTQGVPLRIRSQSSELLIELLEHDVDDTVFELPTA